MGGLFFSAHDQGLYPLGNFRDTLDRSNNNFLLTHEKLAKHKLDDIAHIIVYLNGNIHLWKKASFGTFEEVDKLPTPALMDPYNLRKTLIHKHVRLDLIRKALKEGDINLKVAYTELELISNDLRDLAHYREETSSCSDMIKPMREVVYEMRLASELIQIITLNQNYTQKIMPILMQHAREAAYIQLDGLTNIMNRWFRRNDAINMTNTRVIIVGAQGPREGMIEVQHFQNLYKIHGIKEDDSKKYIRYVESPAASMIDIKIPHLIDELAKHILNQVIGKEMLNDEKAMDKDVLAEFATEYFEKITAEYATEYFKKGAELEEGARCPFRIG